MRQRLSRTQALLRLRDHIAHQGYCPQDRLPPERILAETLGMSRMTLRACLDALEAEGLVWRHVGQGTFYGARPAGRPVRMPLLIEMTSPWDVMAARLAIEPEIAAVAATAATAEQVAFLESCAQAGRSAADLHRCELADGRFHAALARATGNPVLVGFLEFLSGARDRAEWQRQWHLTYRRIGADRFRGEHSDHHRDIVDAIRRHDGDAARAAMRRHLGAVHDAMRAAATSG